MSLNKMQQLAVEKYEYWYKHPESRRRPWFEISGPAGSGKTFLVKYIMDNLGIHDNEVSFMAYVGKATLALRMNGLNAKTIHSSIYDLQIGYVRDEFDRVVFEKGKPKKSREFVKKPELNPEWKQLVVDEGGMVGEKNGNDLLSYNIPTIVLGDLAQLPPVMSKRMFLEEPDIQLNEIMRQEKGSPIIYLSQLASHGIPVSYGSYGESRVIRKKDLKDDDLLEADIVICETNRMRDTINSYIRNNIYGIDSPVLVPGDKIICRQNKWDMELNSDVALVNGLIGYCEKTYKETKTKQCLMEIDFRPEFYKDQWFSRVPIVHDNPFKPYEDRQLMKKFVSNNVLFEFGHCITCHLAQGSQYDNVIVFVESASNSLYFRQWFYTAITRAKKKLTIVI